MKICITNIKVQSISNIGSLNIGRTIISHNSVQTSETNIPSAGQPPPGQVADPTVSPTPAGPGGPPTGPSPSPSVSVSPGQ